MSKLKESQKDSYRRELYMGSSRNGREIVFKRYGDLVLDWAARHLND